jgi:signal transduction histidine kinase
MIAKKHKKTGTKTKQEFKRLLKLANLNLDYLELGQELKDLTKLAAKVMGTEVSLINLLDNHTQWSVSSHGISIQQIPREDSVCQYTISQDEIFEIEDLSMDSRFRDKSYVCDDPRLKYYMGVSIKTKDGSPIGAICVLDKESKTIDPEKRDMLKIIGKEVIHRLEAKDKINSLLHEIKELERANLKVSHDIKNPVSGIIGIAELIENQIETEQFDEISELISVIKSGGESIIELVKGTLEGDGNSESKHNEFDSQQFNCASFCKRLEKMYAPQAKVKNVELTFHIERESHLEHFSKTNLLHIAGNLISNSIKFTPPGGEVHMSVDMKHIAKDKSQKGLTLKISDTGVGMTKEMIDKIKNDNARSKRGTDGENGYSFGLSLVKHLVEKVNGTVSIDSEYGRGTTFTLTLPIKK